MKNVLKVHKGALDALLATIGTCIPFNPGWIAEDGSMNIELAAEVIGEGQLLYTMHQDLPIIMGRFRDQLQILRTTEIEGVFNTMLFEGSPEFMDFIETDGYLKSIESMRLYFAMFEKGEVLQPLIDTFSIMDMGDREVQVVPTEALFQINPSMLSKVDPQTLEGQAAIDAVDEVLNADATTETPTTEEAPAQSGKSDGACLRDAERRLKADSLKKVILIGSLVVVGTLGIAACFAMGRKLAS